MALPIIARSVGPLFFALTQTQLSLLSDQGADQLPDDVRFRPTSLGGVLGESRVFVSGDADVDQSPGGVGFRHALGCKAICFTIQAML